MIYDAFTSIIQLCAVIIKETLFNSPSALVVTRHEPNSLLDRREKNFVDLHKVVFS
jgi:hypothetical protein